MSFSVMYHLLQYLSLSHQVFLPDKFFKRFGTKAFCKRYVGVHCHILTIYFRDKWLNSLPMIRKLLIIVCLVSTVFAAFAGKKKKRKEVIPLSETIIDSGIDYRVIGSPLPKINFLMKNGKLLTNKD